MYFLQKPDDFNPKIEAVGCFVEWDQKILLLRRCKKNDSYKGKWGLPSGKMDPEDKGNTLVAIIRETHEETGHLSNPSEMIYVKTIFVRYENPRKDFPYHIYRAQIAIPKIKLSPTEHDDFKWISPQDALQVPSILMPELDSCIKLVYSNTLRAV
ncbi:MAG: NUDIX hydrolase [Candidatus Pacearchaeota archaeon]